MRWEVVLLALAAQNTPSAKIVVVGMVVVERDTPTVDTVVVGTEGIDMEVDLRCWERRVGSVEGEGIVLGVVDSQAVVEGMLVDTAVAGQA
jgi:hypothetical protein